MGYIYQIHSEHAFIHIKHTQIWQWEAGEIRVLFYSKM